VSWMRWRLSREAKNCLRRRSRRRPSGRGLATYDAEHVSNYPRSFYRFTVRPVGGDAPT
jgi:hypothetical protein